MDINWSMIAGSAALDKPVTASKETRRDVFMAGEKARESKRQRV